MAKHLGKANYMDTMFEKESVRHYISLLQENIIRMASNCSNCKTWLITIVCGLCALQLANDAIKGYLWIALIPTVLFLVLDAYYLGQEKRFRDIEACFVERIKAGEDALQELYTFSVSGEHKCRYFWKGLISPSTWVMYATIAAIILLIVFL